MLKSFLVGYLMGLGLAFVAVTCAKAEDKDIYTQLSQSVVMVTNKDQTGGGTGFILQGKKHAYTITNWHVCEGSLDKDGYAYAHRAGEFSEIKLKIVKSDSTKDLCALVAAPGKILTVGPTADRFSAAYVVGHPLLKPQTPSKGAITGPVAVPIAFPLGENNTKGCPKNFKPMVTPFGAYCAYTYKLLDTTITVFPGNSGSPVVNDQLQLIGVINSVDQHTGWGSMIKLDEINEFMGSL